MEKYEIRRNNLQLLMEQAYGRGARGAKAKLARRLDKQADYISRCLYPAGKDGAKNIGEDFAREIEASFRIDPYSLDRPLDDGASDGAGMSSETLPAGSADGMNNTSPAVQPYKKAREYPLISWIAAGAWQEACDNFSPGDAEEWIDSNANAGPHGYWLEVNGQSMVAPGGDPSFTPRMRILVQPEGFDLVSGRYYIARLISTGETTFKQYIRDAGTEYLQPLNPSYKTMEMGADVEIIGRVVDAKLPKSMF